MAAEGMLLTSESEEETARIAAALAQCVFEQTPEGLVIALHGDLGAGKTAFARGFVYAMGTPESTAVTSPTFTLLNPYEQGRMPLFHYDLYRLADAEELTLAGADEPLDGRSGAALVEWPQRAAELLPVDRLEITLAHQSPEQPNLRAVRFAALGPRSAAVLNALQTQWNSNRP
ncbi:tRNA (adenosine(37)-N6)-threonylcarbamoyltransferase complex ATPase subunit type 1 TsaE [Magnetofaba australis]|uniref:tRNA threonylcarbamoyladenosine biosynthesis protein TsaE n=1 Tax=Magnetofaba australis IT-1 TaxID=1434232 RepID=A0A1Y2K6P2_9PROT|nr:tRNA (adenosine(37)-N6)-threonylcarbamoyltransferase complex ATPase subunit type 1 TsaE [Magnetofaba australis]OSM04967.1 putative nucleoid maintenance ATPase YjeE [Magnetofaba australis IT-1]